MLARSVHQIEGTNVSRWTLLQFPEMRVVVWSAVGLEPSENRKGKLSLSLSIVVVVSKFPWAPIHFQAFIPAKTQGTVSVANRNGDCNRRVKVRNAPAVCG